MFRIYESYFCSEIVCSAPKIFAHCADGDYEKVESCLNDNANIYQRVGDGYNYVPVFVAICKKNERIANLLLDVYERDLRALDGTNFDRALIAMPEDQTEEFWKTVETKVLDDCTPVLIKNNNTEIPNCVYLRKKLVDKNDDSLMLQKKLEAKNGLCDLNWRKLHDKLEDSFLHLAIFHGLKTIVKRLLDNPTVEAKSANSNGHTPLHYAIFAGNIYIIKLLLIRSDYGRWFDDPTYLYQAALSGKLSALEFEVNEMKQNGKSMKEILAIPFSLEDYNQKVTVDNLIHTLIKNGSMMNFFKSSQELFDEDEFCKPNSDGDTILHLLVLNSHHKLNVTIKMINKVAEMYPKLLLVENNDHQLPLHLAATLDILGQRMYKELLKLTIKESGNPDIFYSNMDVAIMSVERAIEINRGVSANYLVNFEKLLQSHGTQLLHKTLKVEKSMRCLKGILSSPVKINPNDFYEGTNAFLLMLAFDINRIPYSGKPTKETLKRFMVLVDYHPIEDINARDSTGMTLFGYIVGFCEDKEYIKSLIDSGADCKVVSNANLSCLHYAASNKKNKEVVRTLLEHGADPQIVDTSRKLPIHYAICSESLDAFEALKPLLHDDHLKGLGCIPIIQFCLESLREDMLSSIWELYNLRNIKVDINHLNEDGKSLWMVAVEQYYQHIPFLFSNFFDEIDFNIKTNSGDTFLHKFLGSFPTDDRLIYFEKFPVLCKILNEQLNIENNEGMTPIDSLIYVCSYFECENDEVDKFIVEKLSIENVKENFHKALKSSALTQRIFERYPNILVGMSREQLYKIFDAATGEKEKRSFDFLLNKLSGKLYDVKHANGKNVIHLICERNDETIICSTMKAMTEAEIRNLAEEIDENNKKPCDYLNGDNKNIFDNIFCLQ